MATLEISFVRVVVRLFFVLLLSQGISASSTVQMVAACCCYSFPFAELTARAVSMIETITNSAQTALFLSCNFLLLR